MRRIVVWLPLLVGLVAPSGCKKPESECMTKCKKLLSCYEETRGKVSDESASLGRCEKTCQGKGTESDRKALAAFGSLDCAIWMKKHRLVAERVINQGKAGPSTPSRPGDGATADYPFPKLQALPPRDPKQPRTGLSPAQTRVDRVVISTATETVELKRVEAGSTPGDTGRWELVQPVKGPGDRFAVRNLLNRLERLHVAGRAELQPSELEANQLTEKLGVRCQVFAGNEVLADMLVGKADRAGAKGRGAVSTLIRKTGTNDIWRITGSLTYLFRRPVDSWRDSSVFAIKGEDLAKLSITLPTGRLVLKRDPEEKDPRKRLVNWEIAESEPKLLTLDQNSITRLVSVLTHLRAPSYEKDAKPETTGLDKPRATVEVQDKSGKAVALLIGNKDPQRRAAYGQVKGDGRVFLVRHPLDELPDDPITSYRDKTLVQAELNQVVGLVVVKEGVTVEFARQGTQWAAVKPADLKMNMSRLISTVRLLEGRFSAHELSKETQKTVTGLDKPDGRIVVKVQPAPDKPVKSTEILVGKVGPRGDYYVQVKGQPEVYLIRRWVLSRVWQNAKEWAGVGPIGGGLGPHRQAGPGMRRPPFGGGGRPPLRGPGKPPVPAPR